LEAGAKKVNRGSASALREADFLELERELEKKV